MATRNRNRGYRESNQQWNDSGNYGQEYQRDYNDDRGGYNSGSTYGNRGYYSEGDTEDSGYYGKSQRRYSDRGSDFTGRSSESQGYYGNQGSRYGEGGTYGNRRRENDYENTGT